ncbi:MAG: DUF6089 family protein [Chitinophagales bacterium]|nr:DUF6089 family protein [Chitinophagales bacterium]
MKYCLSALLFLIAGFAHAQKYKTSNHEIGFGLGIANYLGDLSNNGNTPIFGQIQGKAFRPAVGVLYRSNFNRFLNFRTGLTIGQIYGNDNLSEPGTGRYNRNLHFRSNITDLVLMLEWNMLPYKIGHYKNRFTPYLGFGIGGTYFNPKAQLNGQWVALQPLGTEGQGLEQYPNRTKYAKMAFNLPVSFGMKLNLGRLWAIGAEIQYRYCISDYLDDVSTSYPDFDYYYLNYVEALANDAIALSYRGNETDLSTVVDTKRGNSTNNDSYFFVMFNASLRIGKDRNSCPTLK